MFCPNCGKQLNDNAQFCSGCGTPTKKPAQATPRPAPAAPVIQQPAPKKPSNKKWIPIVAVIAAVVVLLVAVGGLLLSGALGSPKTKVFAAIAKSASAFSEASNNAGIDKPDFVSESGAMSQSISLGIQDLPSMPELAMIDLQMDIDADLEAREFYLSATPSVASSDMFAVELGLENELLLVRVPNLIGDQVYVFNTTSFGQDLYALGGMDEAVASVGFNVFELIETVKAYTEPDENFKEELAKIGLELVDAIEVEKTGKEEIEVNDDQFKTTVYRLTIPEDALKQACEGVLDLSGDLDYVSLCEALIEQLGFPADMVDQAMAEIEMELGNLELGTEIESAIDEILNEIGDIEMDIFVRKGYVYAVEWELSIYDVDFELGAMIGNEDSYTDEMTVLLNVNDEAEIEVHSEGNHGYKGKEFTDTTTLEISGSGMDSVSFTMDTRYAPKESSNNFEWQVTSDFFRAGVEGQITIEKDQIAADLDTVKLEAMGQPLVRLSTTYQAHAYEPAAIHGSEGIELLKLSMDEMMVEATAIATTVEKRMMELAASSPELMEMIEGMM